MAPVQSKKKNGGRRKKAPPQKKPTKKQLKKQLKRTTNKAERQALKTAELADTQKTRQEREAEIDRIKEGLMEWGCTIMYEPIQELYAVLDDFIETGRNISGKIPFPEAPPQPMGRMIVYILNNKRGHQAQCNLMVRNGQPYFEQKGAVQRKTADPQLEEHAPAAGIKGNFGDSTSSAENPADDEDEDVPTLIDINDAVDSSTEHAAQQSAINDTTNLSIPTDTSDTNGPVVEVLDDSEE